MLWAWLHRSQGGLRPAGGPRWPLQGEEQSAASVDDQHPPGRRCSAVGHLQVAGGVAGRFGRGKHMGFIPIGPSRRRWLEGSSIGAAASSTPWCSCVSRRWRTSFWLSASAQSPSANTRLPRCNQKAQPRPRLAPPARPRSATTAADGASSRLQGHGLLQRRSAACAAHWPRAGALVVL